MSYFGVTNTLYIEFEGYSVIDSKDLVENSIPDPDACGNIIAITIEHASKRTEVSQLALAPPHNKALHTDKTSATRPLFCLARRYVAIYSKHRSRIVSHINHNEPNKKK